MSLPGRLRAAWNGVAKGGRAQLRQRVPREAATGVAMLDRGMAPGSNAAGARRSGSKVVATPRRRAGKRERAAELQVSRPGIEPGTRCLKGSPEPCTTPSVPIAHQSGCETIGLTHVL